MCEAEPAQADLQTHRERKQCLFLFATETSRLLFQGAWVVQYSLSKDLVASQKLSFGLPLLAIGQCPLPDHWLSHLFPAGDFQDLIVGREWGRVAAPAAPCSPKSKVPLEAHPLQPGTLVCIWFLASVLSPDQWFSPNCPIRSLVSCAAFLPTPPLSFKIG